MPYWGQGPCFIVSLPSGSTGTVLLDFSEREHDFEDCLTQDVAFTILGIHICIDIVT